MHGRPKLGKHRMVTVATRVEPDELQKLRDLAEECGISLCAYLREMVRLEISRSERSGSAPNAESCDLKLAAVNHSAAG